MRYDLVAFDLYGTLLAIEKLESALEPILGGRKAMMPQARCKSAL